MQAAGGNEGPRQISTHFPVDANDLSRSGPAGKPVKRSTPQFDRPSGSVANEEGGPAESVHPFGEIVEILTVPIPLEVLVERLGDIALPERFADPQAAGRRMAPSALFVESADPPMTLGVDAISPQHRMDLIDQLFCTAQILLIACPPE